MATNQFIIELREDDKYTNKSGVAGSYETILDRPLTIEENDEISLKGAFIDNEQVSSGRITLPEDPEHEGECHIRISFVKYYFDGGTSQIPDFLQGAPDQADIIYTPLKPDSQGAPLAGSNSYPDGQHYFLSNAVATNPPYQVGKVQSITFGQIPNYNPSKAMNAGQPNLFRFAFTYTDHADNPARLEFEIPLNNISAPTTPNGYDYYGKNPGRFTVDGESDGARFEINSLPCVKRDDRPFQVDNVNKYNDPSSVTNYAPRTGSEWLQLYGLVIFSIKVVDVNNFEFVLSPRVETISIVLDATNDYTPEGLATTITRQLTSIHDPTIIQNERGLLDNPLIQTTDELRFLGLAPPIPTPNNFTNQNTDPFFCGEKGDRVLTFGGCKLSDPAFPTNDKPATNHNYLMGTPQFAIEFKPTAGAEGFFQFTQIHGSRFVNIQGSNAVGQTVVNLVDNGFTVAREGNKNLKFVANKNIGVAITQLYPPELWFDIMSFNPSIITNFPHDRSFDATTDSFQTFRAQNSVFKDITVEDGVSTTGQVKSIDIAQQKSITYDLVPSSFRNEIVEPLTIPIMPALAFQPNGALRDEGYYQIEINANGLRTNKYGGTQYNSKIMGLVSKFYQQNAYTSALDGEGSFTYIHKGSPLQLSRFGVRILNPDGSEAEGLAPYTAVFLQVLKNSFY